MEDVYFTPLYKINAQVGNSQLVAHQASSEYIYEDNECSNTIPSCNYHAHGDEYALPPQDREDTPEKRPRTEKKGNIQNIYDEGHYSLARNSGFDKDFSKSVLRTTSTKSEQQVEQKMLKRSHLIIICVIIIVFSIGGILSYVLIDQIGKRTYWLLSSYKNKIKIIQFDFIYNGESKTHFSTSGKTAITIPSTRSSSTQSATRATSSPPIGDEILFIDN